MPLRATGRQIAAIYSRRFVTSPRVREICITRGDSTTAGAVCTIRGPLGPQTYVHTYCTCLRVYHARTRTRTNRRTCVYAVCVYTRVRDPIFSRVGTRQDSLVDRRRSHRGASRFSLEKSLYVFQPAQQDGRLQSRYGKKSQLRRRESACGILFSISWSEISLKMNEMWWYFHLG